MSHHVGSDWCYWIVTDSGEVASKTSVEHVTYKDYSSGDTKAKVKDFEKKLIESLDDSNFILQGEHGIDLKMLEDLDDDGTGAMVEDGITPMEEEYDGMILEEHPEADDEEAVDRYLNMELRMGAGTDDEMFQLLDEIMDHKKDDMAIDIANGTVTLASGNVKSKITTQGWQLLMLWKDKLMSWVKLKDLKASNPIELAEYAVANQISEEPAFKWWVSNTLHKRNHIISKVKKKY